MYTSAQRKTATRLSVPLGFGAGVFGSLVGVGGGVLIVPAMTAVVPIPQRVITGTSLVAVIATASVSTVRFVRGGVALRTTGFGSLTCRRERMNQG